MSDCTEFLNDFISFHFIAIWLVASSCQLVAQRMRVLHAQSMSDHFLLQGDCIVCLMGFNLYWSDLDCRQSLSDRLTEVCN